MVVQHALSCSILSGSGFQGTNWATKGKGKVLNWLICRPNKVFFFFLVDKCKAQQGDFKFCCLERSFPDFFFVFVEILALKYSSTISFFLYRMLQLLLTSMLYFLIFLQEKVLATENARLCEKVNFCNYYY